MSDSNTSNEDSQLLMSQLINEFINPNAMAAEPEAPAETEAPEDTEAPENTERPQGSGQPEGSRQPEGADLTPKSSAQAKIREDAKKRELQLLKKEARDQGLKSHGWDPYNTTER